MRSTRSICAGLLAALLVVAAMAVPDAAVAGSLVLEAGAKTIGTPHADPPWHKHSGDDLVRAYSSCQREGRTERKTFNVNPRWFKSFSHCAQKLGYCPAWTCATWSTTLSCCTKWNCSFRLRR